MADVPLSNVRLVCVDGEITAQSSLLTERSNYFSRVVSEMTTVILELDCNVENAVQMLDFLKGYRIELESVERGIEMYLIGRKFEIKDLEELCRNVLIGMINNDNVCKVYEFACSVNDQLIRYECWKWFHEHAKDILTTDGFIRSKKITVECFVSRPFYRNLNEVNLFNAIYARARSRVVAYKKKTKRIDSKTEITIRPSDIRTKMNFVIDKIRFLSMEKTELEREVFPKDILTPEEQQAICHYLQSGIIKNLPLSICKTQIKRTEDKTDELIVYQHREPQENPVTPIELHDRFVVQFLVMECCFLPSLNLPVTHGQEENIVSITIIVKCDGISRFLVSEKKFSIDKDGTVNLIPPVFLQKHWIVTIRASFFYFGISSIPPIFLRENTDIYRYSPLISYYSLKANPFF